MESRVDVGIVGAGPVGLALAALLQREGVTSRVHERREGLHRDPQAHVINTRTMEILRELGVERAVLAMAAPPMLMRAITWCESLAGREIGRIPLQGNTAALVARFAQSPTAISNLAQNRLEPLLLDLVESSATSEVRFGSEVLAVEESDDGVLLRVREGGAEKTTRARFVVACDGAGSRIRRALGIEMDGPSSLQSFVSVYFEADLGRFLGARSGPLFWICGPRTRGVIIGFDLAKTWALMVPYSEPHRAEDFTPEVVQRMVGDAIGDSGVPFRITSVGNWNMSAQVADRYRSGRVFLAGDAAHRFPPSGGLGMNTGIQDAHNLAWKLAAVLRGEARPALLDSYENERRPVAQGNSDQSLRNAMRMMEVDMALEFATLAPVDPGVIARDEKPVADLGLDGDSDAACDKRARVQAVIDSQAEHFDFGGLDLGFRYESGAVVPDGSEAPPFDVQRYTPSSRPGSRLPHVWLTRLGERRSTLDVAQPGRFTLFTTPLGAPHWLEAARELLRDGAAELGIEVVSEEEARGAWLDASRAWSRLAGIGEAGALLVRPDGHVAWRSARAARSVEEARDLIENVFDEILCRRSTAKEASESAA